MRFLILAYSYPPSANPRAIRFAALAEYWAKRGHEMDVVCGWAPNRPRYELRNGVNIYRVGGNLTERLRARLRPHGIPTGSVSTSEWNSAVVPQTVKRGLSLKKLARVCHDLTWKQLYWPDSNCFWYAPACKAALSLLQTHTYDAVISVSLPFTSHLVAHRLRNRMRGAKWLVDSGDPFSFLDQCRPNNKWLYRNLNFACEQKIFRAASALSVTCEQTAAKYRDLFPDCAAKIHVIPPLATPCSGGENSPSSATNTGTATGRPIQLMYAGTLYRNIRNPSFLLELFAKLLQRPLAHRLELHLYGLSHDCSDIIETYRRQFTNQLHVHGSVSPQAAHHAMRKADMLVNLGNSTDYQLPSKVVDYAASGKPILNLVSIAADSSARFLNSHPGTLTIKHNGAAIEENQVLRVAEFIKSPPSIDFRRLRQWMQPYEIDQIAAQYTNLVADHRLAIPPAAEISRAA